MNGPTDDVAVCPAAQFMDGFIVSHEMGSPAGTACVCAKRNAEIRMNGNIIVVYA